MVTALQVPAAERREDRRQRESRLAAIASRRCVRSHKFEFAGAVK
jgi:hypothetical protein